MIRSSKHSLKFSNPGKLNILEDFLREYRAATQLAIDFIWSNRFEVKDKVFDISYDLLDLPLFLNYKDVNYSGNLSARAFCSAFEQAIDIVRSQIEKRKCLLFIQEKLISEGKSTDYIDGQLEKHRLIKPLIKNIPAELSSKCVDFSFRGEKKNHFDLFIRIKSTGFSHIKLPIKLTRPFNKRKSWKLLKGISISEDCITLRQEQETPEKKTEGRTVGADTGIKNIYTLSDGQVSNADIHGHTLESIVHKLKRKKKGSKAFKKAQDHRENHINWSINQINFFDIKQINLEKVNTFNGGKKSRFLSHFAHSEISDKIINLAEELGVQVKLQPCEYKSQRCSSCGFVCKDNRKGKSFCCKNCNHKMDADLNAAINNEKDLPFLNKARAKELVSFFWKETNSNDQELIESLMPEKEI
jgi:Putative transposase DNA-binding domain